ncbi:MAG: hypothetical protein KME59_02780 [Trichormus sp. ATA11-4-KO1]|jgi:signal transduction histidine kinase|nr:hypothetical protein [Trichormus sp. ATA11-4-KO1]
MSIVKRLPWISLVLVLLSYSTLGWFLSETQAPVLVWIVLMLGILLLVGSLTTPWSAMANYYTLLFRSNLKSFAVAVVGAFLFFLMLAWFRLFLDTLLIVSAAILARIDFQTAGFTQGQAFLFTFIFSLVGLALGKVLHMGFLQQLW